MKIFIFKQTLEYGGSSKMMIFIANALAKIGHEVIIFMYENATEEDVRKITLQKLNNRVKFIEYNGIAVSSNKHINNIKIIKKTIAEQRPDVIVSFLTFPNFYATIVGNLLGIPVIISERGNPYVIKNIKDKIVYSFFNFASGAVFQTEGAKAYFSKRLQKQSCVIPNPVVRENDNVRFDTSTDNHEIVFIARFENMQKRQDLMVNALEKVVKVFPDTILKFYGTGKDLPMIENIVKEKNLESNVRFIGYTNNPEEEMVKSEVFVLTSDYEGIPNSLIEAMSVGMPVVSTDCDPGGARMLIEDGVNGILVPKNDAQGIADAIIRIFKDKELREKLSREAYKITEKYTEEKIAEQWHDYITSVAKRHK